ncbi:Uncharacterised protein [uncultured archaeon]|nr:Uncharacterised protein [uncultured archaeon]
MLFNRNAIKDDDLPKPKVIIHKIASDEENH